MDCNQMAVTMIVNSKSNRLPASSIAKECGMTVNQVRWIISKMRKSGAIPAPKKYLVVAESRSGVIRFDSIKHAVDAGYSETGIKRCWSGKQEAHAGYSWRKEYITPGMAATEDQP